jgi:glutamine cyclotransferase
MKKWGAFLHMVLILLIPAAISCNSVSDEVTKDVDNSTAPATISYSILEVLPHDTSSYTQGLEWHQGNILESSGRNGFSRLSFIDPKYGKVIQSVSQADEIFSEGATIFKGKIYQLTWTNNIVNVYDPVSLKLINQFDWPYQGWGLTNNGKELIVSTGSSNLYFTNDSLIIKQMTGVTDQYGPVPALNELEYIDSFVYANQYETNYILKIDPQSGKVVGKMDLTGLLAKSGMSFNPNDYTLQSGNVLNGIAYDSSEDVLYVTGKLWPAMFKIKLTNQ